MAKTKKEIPEEPEKETETEVVDVEKMKEEALKEYYTSRTTPINNLDASFMTAEPDYSHMQNTFKTQTGYVDFFEVFNSSIRLANTPSGDAKRLSYMVTTASFFFRMGKINVCLMELCRVVAELEVSQGVKGFRTNAMNSVIQEIRQSQEKKTTKKGIMGNTKED